MVFTDQLLLVLKNVWDIFLHPWQDIQTLWMILPLVIILILIHIYFGRYRSEELGWNSAFSNSVSLLWICVILFRFLFEKYAASELFYGAARQSLVLVGILSLWVIILLTFNFFHTLPKHFAFVISSSDAVYILAYIVISLIAGEYTLDQTTLLAAFTLFIALLFVLETIKKITPMTQSARQILKKRKEKKTRRKAGKKAARTKKIKKLQGKVKRKIRWFSKPHK